MINNNYEIKQIQEAYTPVIFCSRHKLNAFILPAHHLEHVRHAVCRPGVTWVDIQTLSTKK